MKTAQEEFTEEVNKFSEEVMNITKGMFNENKQINPVVFALVYQENGRLAVAVLDGLGELFTSSEGKDMAAEVIRKVGKELKPICIAFCSEAWASHYGGMDRSKVVDENGDFREGIPAPSEDPNRREVLMIHIETFEKESFTYWNIEKENGSRVLVDSDMSKGWTDKKVGPQAGRFSGLLQENHSEWAKTLQKSLKLSLN